MAKKVIEELLCYDYFRRPAYDAEPDGVSLTEQSHKDACDINMIIKRYSDGVVPDLRECGPGNYGDFTKVMSYGDAMMAVREANDAFMKLPGEVRARFNHDPGAFIAFCEDPKNGDEMVKMGLAIRDEPDKASKGGTDESKGDSKKGS